jgi:hypothetical protein
MGNNLQTTEFDEWEEIAERVKQIDNDVTALVTLLNSIPKSEWEDEQQKASEGMSELKGVLEERLAKEHPEKWEPQMFYGEPNNPSWD